MKHKFKDKYRIESTRLSNHDYAANGYYFVTICTGDRTCFFGNIIQGKIHLSAIGEIAQQFWSEIPSHFECTSIDAYIIMPNHVHGIVIIDRPYDINTKTRHGASLHMPSDRSNKFAPLKSGSLQAVINAYKSSVTRWCRKNGQEHFSWQSRFYEHIIRADGSLGKIQEYIINNPAKWEEDKDNLANLWM